MKRILLLTDLYKRSGSAVAITSGLIADGLKLSCEKATLNDIQEQMKEWARQSSDRVRRAAQK